MKQSPFRYGFKSEASAWARDFRDELGLATYDPLCPWMLAEHLAVPLLQLTEFVSIAGVEYLATEKGKKEFSATACFDGPAAFVIYNNTHARVRQASSIAHELAHIVLRHPPQELINADGTRAYDAVYEAEAQWLGPTLLISDEAALHILEQAYTNDEATRRYGVSSELIAMRINVTGARKRLARRRAA